MSILTEAENLVGARLSEVERALIIATLDRCGGNRTHAAKMLGVSLRTIRNKIRQYADDIHVPPPARSADIHCIAPET